MKINVLTLFKEMFVAVKESSILGKACEKGALEITLTDIRDYTLNKHNKVDDYPYGGGVGMLMQAEPIFRCLEDVGARNKKIIYMSPKGKVLNQEKVFELAKEEELVILCGHYEGVDQRVLDYWNVEEISIGDYILTGGEPAAIVLIDSIARLVPGVLGDKTSATEESIYSGLLEHPQYTKPREYEGLCVPEVLVNGNHKLIHLWQFEKSLELTKQRRPDLFEKFCEDTSALTKEEKIILEKICKMV
ncbi:MAG: tRNA (guanosine(37)-N1)-methyltransferase TrmD [Anaerovoracaceae bacterium]